MGTIVYGTYHFTKLMGYFGEPTTCPVCRRTYKQAIVKDVKWGHVDYIPLLPMGSQYIQECPICAEDKNLTKKLAQNIMNKPGDGAEQKLTPFVRYDKPNKYREFIIKDEASGEEICVASGISKSDCKHIAKDRGLKKVPIIEM